MRWSAFLVSLCVLAACTVPGAPDAATGRQRYMAAKADCVASHPDRLVAQSDCRARAANSYIRPFYKYGDLMDRAQEQRRVLAGRADRHEISRASYEHQVAQSDAAISREEDRRNRLARSGKETGPFAGLAEGIAGLFR